MLFSESHIGRYLGEVHATDFIVFPEQKLAEKDIATALVPHFHKAWELKFFYPFGEAQQHAVVFVAPGIIHASTPVGCKLSLEVNHHQVVFGPSFTHLWKNQILDEEDMAINIVPSILLALSKIQNTVQFSKISYNLMSSVLNNLMFLLDSASQKQKIAVQNSPLENALNYIQNFYFETHMSVLDIALYAGISPQYLNILFQQKTGKTTRQTLVEERLQQAKKLLVSSTCLVKDVARLTGWSCPYYFSTCFKKYYGVTPESVAKGKKVFMDSGDTNLKIG